MLGPLAIPPRLIVRALDDLHTLANSLRRLADHEGDLAALVDSVQVLPRVEDELSANVAALRDDVRELNGSLLPLSTQLDKLSAQLEPMSAEVRDLDQTAEALEASMASLQTLLKKLPGI